MPRPHRPIRRSTSCRIWPGWRAAVRAGNVHQELSMRPSMTLGRFFAMPSTFLSSLHERLLGQHRLARRSCWSPAFDHLGDDVLRLAFLSASGRPRSRISRSFSTSGRIEFLLATRRRADGRDVHGRCRWPFARRAAFDLQQHADRAVVMDVAAVRTVDPHDPLELEHLADAVVQVVELLPQRCDPSWPGEGWSSRCVGRSRAGTRGKLLGQVVGQCHELLVVGHRGAFAAQLDHCADTCCPQSA